MKEVFIASFDLEVGGVERSLISMLGNFDYKKYNVDLMLYSHSGDFMQYLDKKVNLLPEDKKYATIRMPIANVLKKGYIKLAASRVLAKMKGQKTIGQKENVSQMQYMWKYAINNLPSIKKEYDLAISYLWPHYCVAEKVNAKVKVAWIHTDYGNIETDIEEDLKIWNKFDHIISISDSVTKSFLAKYPSLKEKIVLVENITSPTFIRYMANEKINEMQNKSEFKILSVARFSYAKGIDNAVKALKILHNRGLKNIKWYVVGYGGDEEAIKNLIKENQLEDSFILLGKKINPYPYMRACDLYVQPSRYEGKAVTVSEAQILGKAVMITNYETAKSQLRDGYDGYIADLSIEGIARGIKDLYQDIQLREILESECEKNNYSNLDELQKLYSLIN